MLIRPAELGDGPAVLALVQAMGGHDEILAQPDARATFASAITRPEIRVMVADDGGTVVGYAEVHARPSVVRGCREAWLAGLVVAPDRRSQSVGSHLLAAVDTEARALGCACVVLESSTWRDRAHAFYRRQGFDDVPPAARFVRPLAETPKTLLEDRFLAAAARAATMVAAAVTGLADEAPVAMGADGAPTEAADRRAEDVAVACLHDLDLAIVSEEAGAVGGRQPEPGEAWIALDPLDGSRNFRSGLPPYATAMGLVRDGRALAGFVADLTSGRRWWAAAGGGAWVDGRPARSRPGPIALRPSPEPGQAVHPVPGYDRVRVSGSTTTDLCRVADGSAGAFVDLDRGVVHVHDLAGPLAVLTEAGAVIASAEDRPWLVPDPARRLRLVAASNAAEAERLLGSVSIRG